MSVVSFKKRMSASMPKIKSELKAWAGPVACIATGAIGGSLVGYSHGHDVGYNDAVGQMNAAYKAGSAKYEKEDQLEEKKYATEQKQNALAKITGTAALQMLGLANDPNVVPDFQYNKKRNDITVTGYTAYSDKNALNDKMPEEGSAIFYMFHIKGTTLGKSPKPSDISYDNYWIRDIGSGWWNDKETEKYLVTLAHLGKAKLFLDYQRIGPKAFDIKTP